MGHEAAAWLTAGINAICILAGIISLYARLSSRLSRIEVKVDLMFCWWQQHLGIIKIKKLVEEEDNK